MRKRVAIVLVACLLAGVGSLRAGGVSTAAAEESAATAAQAPAAAALSDQERDRQAESIARSIMSPFCPGRTVSACPNAGPWRDDIRNWVSEGVPAEEIRARLAARVPAHNLEGAPIEKHSWVLPVGLSVLGIGMLVFLLRYLVTPRREDPLDGTGAAAREATGPDADAAASEDWDKRLDQELDSLES
jgi:cytochrome c-type biogenesis protein CcmH/NrfF